MISWCRPCACRSPRRKRQKFGASSQMFAREIEQLELALAGLQIA